jgi:hypothetical protein
MFVRLLKRALWYLGLGMMFMGAALGIPIVIDPPPRDKVEESQDQSGTRRRKRKRRGG